jgi:GTP-binding protein
LDDPVSMLPPFDIHQPPLLYPKHDAIGESPFFAFPDFPRGFNREVWYDGPMKKLSARFVKGLVGPDPVLADGTPQVAFIGRSNGGKSSVINSLTGQEGLARTSSTPGRTQEINVFLVENRFYLLDLPGFGYSKHPLETQRRLHRLIDWYLFQSPYRPKKVVLIVDAEVGPTDSDLEMLQGLEAMRKPIVIVANKTDKIKASRFGLRMREIQARVGAHKVIPYSSEKRIGQSELAEALFG